MLVVILNELSTIGLVKIQGEAFTVLLSNGYCFVSNTLFYHTFQPSEFRSCGKSESTTYFLNSAVKSDGFSLLMKCSKNDLSDSNLS